MSTSSIFLLSDKGPSPARPSPGGVSSALFSIVKKYKFNWIYCEPPSSTFDVKFLADFNASQKRKAYQDYRSYKQYLHPLNIKQALWENYYLGACTQSLWPLLHNVRVKPSYRTSWWNNYGKVNSQIALLAAKLSSKSSREDSFFVNDYQLFQVGKYLRRYGVTGKIIFFLHTTWPDKKRFLESPWKERIINSLLYYDKLVFQTKKHCLNFLGTLRKMYFFSLKQIGDDKYLTYIKGKKITIQWAPIGTDPRLFIKLGKYNGGAYLPFLNKIPKNSIIALGVDRLDYIKGIPSKIRIFGEFLKKYDRYLGKLVLVQLVTPSVRLKTSLYVLEEKKIKQTTQLVNHKWKGQTPIILLETSLYQKNLIGLYRIAKICIVFSLHDGMNLVAKEFVASNFDRDVALLLSSKCGASEQLSQGAFLFNPHRKSQFFKAILTAINTPKKERAKRMSKMIEIIKKEDLFWWLNKVIE